MPRATPRRSARPWTSSAWSAPTMRARACSRRCRNPRSSTRSPGSAGTSRRSRRESWPAACTPPSSRSCRIDRAGGRPGPAVLANLEGALARAIGRADAVIVSDYGGGLATPAFWQRALSAARVKQPPHVLVDSRYSLTGFTGMTACTPNESEVEAVLGVRINDDPAVLEKAGRELLDPLAFARRPDYARQPRHGALRAREAHRSHPDRRIGSRCPTSRAPATPSSRRLRSRSRQARRSREAARLANHAGGLVVMKRGTATVSAAELADAVK